MTGVLHTGLQNDGRYVVSADEKNLGCRGVTSLVTREIDQMQKLPDRAAKEKDAVPNTVAGVFSWMSGDTKAAIPSLTEYEKGRKRAEALNAVLIEKKCPPVDINAALNESDVITSAIRTDQPYKTP